MSECVTEIIGIKDSQLTSTSEITTTDDNGDFVSVSYAIVDGALPSGLSINSSNGVIYGTPTSIGNTTFKIQASGLIGSK
jgi:hypothetical protein